MLFSHPDVVRSLNERFECAWEMLRPVPKVTIDFGDGSVLERTLHGNIATCITLADGRVIDAIPGLVDPVEYQRRLDAALRLHGQVVFTLTAADDARATELVQAYHGDPATWADVDPAEKLAVLTEERSGGDDSCASPSSCRRCASRSR